MVHKSKTHIKQQLKRKTHAALAATIRLALKNKAWKSIAGILAGPTRHHPAINLADIETKTSVGDTVIVPGKVLSLGTITKKIRIAALSISAAAREKLRKTKSEVVSLAEEIQKNPRAEGIKIISSP